VHSYTEPREGIVDYPDWYLARDARTARYRVIEGGPHGKTVIARLEGVEDRDAAEGLIGAEIAVPRDALPEPGPGEYYWADLIGLAVVNREGLALGRVERLMETGAHDVLVLRGPETDEERLVPFAVGRTVDTVDLDAGVIRVDWQPDY
jgi:16S rRNA processing protein RimM